MIVLPITYWLALMLATVLLMGSIARRRITYFWASAILITVLIPGLGDLIYQYPRDIFAIVATQTIAAKGSFSPADHVLLNFPAPELVFAALAAATGAGPLVVVRGFGVAYNLVILMLCFVFFCRLGLPQDAAVLGALTLVLAFYLQGTLIYSSLIGFIFFILVAGIILAPFSDRRVTVLLLGVFFSAMVVSHAFSPYLTIASVAIPLMGWKIADSTIMKLKLSHFCGERPPSNWLVLILFLLILTAYWAYFASTPFSWGLLALNSRDLLSLLEGASSPLISPQTAYERSYVQVTQIYAPVMFFAFVVYLFTIRDGRRLQLVLMLAGLSGALVFALAGYLQEFLARIFAFATFPLSYGVGMLFGSSRRILRGIGIIALLMVMTLHLPAHYGQDSFQVIPDATIQGVKFVALHTYSNASFSSPFRSLSWSYYFDVYRLNNPANAGPGLYYVLDYASNSWILYTNGDSALRELTNRVTSDRYDRVYSNGMFDLYLQI